MRCALSDIYDTDNEKTTGRLFAAKKLADCDITYMYSIYSLDTKELNAPICKS